MCAFRPPPCRVLGHVFEGSLLDLVCICRNRSRNVRRPAQTEAVTSGRVSKPKPLATLRVQSEAAGHDAQARRSRHGIMYVINDTGPGHRMSVLDLVSDACPTGCSVFICSRLFGR